MRLANLWLSHGKTMDHGIKGRHIFVTGASGFIGARLTECLTMAYGAEVHALVRRLGTVGTARLARLPRLKMFRGDIRDVESIRKAARGCSHFIHCATGTPGGYWKRSKESVRGTRNVLEVAAHEGAERVVYFSSAAVHDPARSGEVIHEESLLNGRFPTSVKIPAETLVSQYYHRHGLPTVVLRPTCVWGPFSPIWTIAAMELIRKGTPFLPLGGRGTANAIYIDNLVDAVYLALIKTESVGQVFILNDDEPKTWGELYGGYARFLGVALPFLSDSSYARDLLRVSVFNMIHILRAMTEGKGGNGVYLLREIYDHVPIVKLLVSSLPEQVTCRLRMYAAAQERAMEPSSRPGESHRGFLGSNFVSRHIRELYGSKSRYSSEKAKRILGWHPRVSFPQALERTCKWLQYAGYKDSTAQEVKRGR